MNRYAVVKLLFSFGYEVRPCIRRLNGELHMPTPYKVGDVKKVYKNVDSAERYAAFLNEEAQADREAKVFNLSERWD